MSHSLSIHTLSTLRDVCTVQLDADGKLAFPRLEESPGIYCFTLNRTSGGVAVCVGESDRLRRTLKHYRTRGPSQQTNLRISHLMTELLREDGTVSVSVAERATIDVGGSHHALDLAGKCSRVLVETAWLLELKCAGLRVKNL